MIVKNVMKQNISRLLTSNTLLEAAEFLNESGIGFIPVTDEEQHLKGVFTKQTILNAMKKGKNMNTFIDEVMDTDIDYIYENEYVSLAFDKKKENIFVVDYENHLVGVLSKTDLLKTYYKELHYTTNSLNAMVESTNSAIVAINNDNKITVFNRAAREIFDLSDQNVINSHINDIIPDSCLPDIIKNGECKTSEYTKIMDKILLVNRTPIVENNSIIGAVAVFQDVTEYNNALKELNNEKHLTEILQTILEIAYDGILVIDKDARVTMISKTYAMFLGVKEEEVIGKHVTEVVENTRMHKVMETGQPEVAQLHKIKGSYMIATRIPIFKNGEVVGAVGKVVFRNLKDLSALYNTVSKMEKELEHYKGEIKQLNTATYSFDNIVGNSKEIQEVKALAKKAAATDSNVLILGESGTGKEVFAHAIHKASKRAYGPFVKINCAAIPTDLLESELFGYEGGAFTGAKKEGKMGKFEIADGGTIFLDEIGDMPLHMQAKLLRVLQEKEVEKIGAAKPKPINVRIIAATNQGLQPMIEEGKFRADLFYRLNVVKISIPALRDRKTDIETLSYYILDKICNRLDKYTTRISKEAMEYLKNYKWVGNVRELENVIERAINLVDSGDVIQVKHLPKEIVGIVINKEIKSLEEVLKEAEKQAIVDSLIMSKGNKSQAAKMLGISRTSFYEKVNKLGIDEEIFYR